MGALEAADDQLATVLAREVYLRRAEGDRLWVVRRDHVIVADDDFAAPNADKPHRHHDGAAVAERRRASSGRRVESRRSPEFLLASPTTSI